MKDIFIKLISEELHLPFNGVKNTLLLLEEGASIPFISRYRKERTGELDEVQVENISDLFDKYSDIEKRKDTIISTLTDQNNLTPDLKNRIDNCWNLSELEDIYLPFKPKRHTKAEIARKKGLEPLAKIIMSQNTKDISKVAFSYINNDVETADDAIIGARDIIAEWINENEKARNIVRHNFKKSSVIVSKVVKGKELEAMKYKDYFEFSKPLKYISSHQYLALTRGEREGFLRISINPREDYCYDDLYRVFVRSESPASQIVKQAVDDSYKRLLKPSIETEFSAISKEKADEEAIKIFAENLRQLLLAAPLGQKKVLAIDPGFRTGCKLVCLDAQGKLVHNETIYPHFPQNEKAIASKKISHLVEMYNIEAIAIGNGTASRETEEFITGIRYDRKVQVFVVSENGASIYSASKVAREEFPEYDVTVRGAVSIGRRLMDPLAELVKIDPKSIGVGQYQHDVDATKLKKSLDNTVVSSVNLVGVNLNTASKFLLTYVSGLNATVANNIVAYRDENGPFSDRNELNKVPRVGPKSFEQAAGFLRIPGAKNPLDNTAVHPESYTIVERMAKDKGCTVEDLIRNKEIRNSVRIEDYVTENIGLPTLKDIMSELDKPGRDPRSKIEVMEFDKNIRKIEDLKAGMVLNGIVSNITAFGCFVDIGIKENGLVHVSEMSETFVTDPNKIVTLHQHIKVKVLTIDLVRKRIQLSLKL